MRKALEVKKGGMKDCDSSRFVSIVYRHVVSGLRTAATEVRLDDGLLAGKA